MIKHLISLLLCSCCYAQLDGITWTQGADGRYYPNNLTLTVGSDGRLYSTITASTPSAWQLPEYASTVLWYKFDEATNSAGQIVDSSSTGTNVGILATTSANYPTWYLSSNGISASYGFNGSDNYMYRTNLIIYSNKFSVSTWVRQVGITGAYDRIIEQNFRNSFYLGLNSTATKYQWIVNDSSVSKDVSGGIVSKGWDFLVGTYDGTNGYLYYNGILVDNDTFTLPTAMNKSVIIGKDALASSGYYDGYIDAPLVYSNIALTSDQVLDIFTNTWQYHGWSNSLALSNNSLWSNTVAEYNFDYNYPADTSYIGTNHLALTGGSTDSAWRADGTNGWYEADGSSDYLRYALQLISASSTNYSMSCYFKPTVTNVARQVLMTVNSANTNTAINIELQLDKIAFTTHSSGFTNVIGTTIISTTAWHKVTITCANTTGSIYLDGALENNGTVASPAGLTRTELMAINGSLYYAGLMDRVRIFNRALSAGEANGL